MRIGPRRSIRATMGAMAWLASACGHLTPQPAAVQQAHAPAAPERQEEKVLVTGSRIPRRIDTTSGLPATAWPVRIYSRRDLLGAGRPETADALRQLDPSVR